MAEKKLNLQPPKGFRDFLPAKASKRSQIINKITKVVESYGFEPLETPALEYAQILEGKYGEEEKLIFKFEDRGGRELALRYDQTVPLARVIANYKDKLPFPFKRYQVQPAWRAEKPQSGRYREFLQFDFDIIGTSSPLADAEIIAVTDSVLTHLGFNKFLILYNDRRVLTRIIQIAGIKKDLELPVIRTLDKLEKIGEPAVIEELEKFKVPKTKIELLMYQLGRRPVLPKTQKPEINLTEIDQVMGLLKNFKVPAKHTLYSPALARGLDYYTGLIIEPVVENYQAGSLGGGGRYDELIGMFAGEKIPAVGFSFGIDRLLESMTDLDLLGKYLAPTQVLITIFKPELIDISSQIAQNLREQNFKAELYLDPQKKLEKQIKYAVQKNIPWVVICGPDELETQSVTLKNLKTRTQETIPQSLLAEKLK